MKREDKAGHKAHKERTEVPAMSVDKLGREYRARKPE